MAADGQMTTPVIDWQVCQRDGQTYVRLSDLIAYMQANIDQLRASGVTGALLDRPVDFLGTLLAVDLQAHTPT